MLSWVAVASVSVLTYLLAPGLVHPDEVFQVLEPANRFAFDVGVRAWEWDVGLRNWAYPGLLGVLLKLFGGTNVWLNRALVMVPSLVLHVFALRSVHLFAERRLPSVSGMWSVALVGCSPLVLVFAMRTLSESTSAALLIIAFERLEGPRRIDGFLAGVAFGLAEVARYGTAPFIMVTLGWLAVRRSRTFWPVVVGGALCLLALAILDRVTWGVVLERPNAGGWAHSLLEYVDFNLVKGKASGFGRSPWWAYFPHVGLALVAVSLLRWRATPSLRAPLPAIAALVYFVSLVVVPHKEARFLYPALVVLLLLSAPAFVSLTTTTASRAVSIGAMCLLSVPLLGAELRPKGSELVTLTARASAEGRGLLIVHAGLWGTGGSFFAGGPNVMVEAPSSRPHQWCSSDETGDACFVRALGDPTFDRAIVEEPHDEATLGALHLAGFRQVEQHGSARWFAR